MDDSFVSVAPPGGGEVKSYNIHVSSKYLDLTKRKFEICRLPHDLALEKGREWDLGTPKSVVEPLIDYWLEDYDWRAVESQLNSTLPQFRLAIPPPASFSHPLPPPLRIHFIHMRSSSPSAIPLLLLPSFPFTNLSFAPLFSTLSSPTDNGQAYHIISPSFPGLGFSDPFTTPPSHSGILSTTAHLFATLMQSLGYDSYIVSSTGSGIQSPAGIDYHLPRLIAETDPNCKGAHLIDPLVPKPTPATHLGNWLKFRIAHFFHASIFGYSPQDWAASTRRALSQPIPAPGTPAVSPSPHDLESGGVAATSPRRAGSPVHTASAFFRRPFSTPSTSVRSPDPTSCLGGSATHLTLPATLTLAYSLCDSPTGLLSLLLLGLHSLAPSHTLTSSALITLVQLAWLPGPEGALRYWSAADAEMRRAELQAGSPQRRAVVSITAYVDAQGCGAPRGEGAWSAPVWAQARHDVVSVERREGVRGLPWENGEQLLGGIRALSAVVFPCLAGAKAGMGGRAERMDDVGGELGELGDGLQLDEVVVHSSSDTNPLHPPQGQQGTQARPHATQPRSPGPVISQTYASISHSHSATRDSSASATRNARGEEIINEDTEPETPDLQEGSLDIGEVGLLEVPRRPGMEEAGSSETVVGTLAEDGEGEKGKGKGVMR